MLDMKVQKQLSSFRRPHVPCLSAALQFETHVLPTWTGASARELSWMQVFCPGLGENSTESGNQTVHVSLDTDLESATGAIRAIAQHSFLIL
jgi:hypothetical protein